MLELVLPETELFDEKNSKIIRLPKSTLRLEHSLLSLSKWESVWEVPFISREPKTREQLMSYIAIMSLDPISVEDLQRLESVHFETINEYLERKHSATWFSDTGSKGGTGRTITSELIYYWMTSYNVPFVCETWPLARLMNLIRIAQIKAEEADPNRKNKRPSSTMLSERAALNAKRREQLNSKG